LGASVVEARTIARCCLENLFWIGGLAAKGEAFVKQMEDDNDVNKQKLGNALLANSKMQGGDAELEGKLEAFLDELRAKEQLEIEEVAKTGEKKAKKTTIGHKNEADAAKISQAYIFYRQLSGDSAHPSATSLSRHIDETADRDHPTFSGDPIVRPDEPEETFQVASMALLGVCIVANDMLKKGALLPGDLAAIKDRFLALNATKPVTT